MLLQPRIVTPLTMSLIVRRSAATAALPIVKHKHVSEGDFVYSRNWSRDTKFARSMQPPQMGNLPSTFLTRRLGHTYELYPLFFLYGFLATVMATVIYISFEKLEVWVDHTKDHAPAYDWSRIRNNYWKQHTLALDPEGKSHRRLPMMEMLEDEMMNAANQRHEHHYNRHMNEIDTSCHN